MWYQGKVVSHRLFPLKQSVGYIGERLGVFGWIIRNFWLSLMLTASSAISIKGCPSQADIPLSR